MKKTLKDIKNLNNKKVLLRLDLNVPFVNNKILDYTRIDSSIPTINYLLDHNCKIVIFAHLSRILSEEDKNNNSLNIIVPYLKSKIKAKVIFSEQTSGPKLDKLVENLKEREIILIENTRFEDVYNNVLVQKETKCDEDLSKYWASLGDIFINDAFGMTHRKHASNYGISKYVKESGIGFLVESEIKALTKLLNPDLPFIVLLGGKKVKDKISLFDSLLKVADKIIIGPAMLFTFQKAMGHNVGASYYDPEMLDYCKILLEKYNDKILLTTDVIGAKKPFDKTKSKVFNELKNDYIGVDLGPKSIKLILKEIKKAKTIFWNGPFGVIEIEKYQKGSLVILKKLNSYKNKFIVIGGGETASLASKKKYKNISHISTGGGASISFLENHCAIALEVIEEK